MIKRIEVLQDGASPIYGSDAIAGVVNIITKKSQKGFVARREELGKIPGIMATASPQNYQVKLGSCDGPNEDRRRRETS